MTKSVHSFLSPLDPADYSDFTAFLKNASGIDLGDNKQYLVSSRMRRILIEFGLPGLKELTARVKQDSVGAIRQRVLDAMTTNETFWFRDAYPFDYFSNTVMPNLIKKGNGGPLRVWCAACSSGQEPYSLSMLREELATPRAAGNDHEVDILATDLSSEVVQSAKSAVYDGLSVVRGLSEHRLAKHFTKLNQGEWQVNSNIRKRVRFRAMNLQDSYRALGKFDVIFCRNVLIYFSPELKIAVLTKLHAALNPGGYLLLGASESTSDVTHLFEMVNCSPGVAYQANPIVT